MLNCKMILTAVGGFVTIHKFIQPFHNLRGLASTTLDKLTNKLFRYCQTSKLHVTGRISF